MAKLHESIHKNKNEENQTFWTLEINVTNNCFS